MAPIPLTTLVENAYRTMAAAGYRPAAPGDGYGNITVPIADLDLDDEARQYARAHVETEEHGTGGLLPGAFLIGCADYSTAGALPLVIEAARLLCAPEPALARRLLEAAIDALPAE